MADYRALLRGGYTARRRATQLRGPKQEFWCPVVSEQVLVRLRRHNRFGDGTGYYVQCNQQDCQYVEENRPPCPLTIDMFADAIRERQERHAANDDADVAPDTATPPTPEATGPIVDSRHAA